MIKKIKRFFWYLLVSSLLYVVVLIFVFPPITITQLTNAFGLGLKRDYVAWDDLSYNIKLAAIASEDQAFPDHIGVDWEAMERSFKTKKKKRNLEFHLAEALVRLHSKLQKMYSYGKVVNMTNTFEKFLNFILHF